MNVEDPVSKYYQEAPASWKGMTIHHLLTHTSGLPENEWENFYKGKCTTYSTEEQVKTFRGRPLGFPRNVFTCWLTLSRSFLGGRMRRIWLIIFLSN